MIWNLRVPYAHDRKLQAMRCVLGSPLGGRSGRPTTGPGVTNISHWVRQGTIPNTHSGDPGHQREGMDSQGGAVNNDITQQAQDVESMLVWSWSSFVDSGAALNQHWFKVLWLLGHYDKFYVELFETGSLKHRGSLVYILHFINNQHGKFTQCWFDVGPPS